MGMVWAKIISIRINTALAEPRVAAYLEAYKATNGPKKAMVERWKLGQKFQQTGQIVLPELPKPISHFRVAPEKTRRQVFPLEGVHHSVIQPTPPVTPKSAEIRRLQTSPDYNVASGTFDFHRAPPQRKASRSSFGALPPSDASQPIQTEAKRTPPKRKNVEVEAPDKRPKEDKIFPYPTQIRCLDFNIQGQEVGADFVLPLPYLFIETEPRQRVRDYVGLQQVWQQHPQYADLTKVEAVIQYYMAHPESISAIPEPSGHSLMHLPRPPFFHRMVSFPHITDEEVCTIVQGVSRMHQLIDLDSGSNNLHAVLSAQRPSLVEFICEDARHFGKDLTVHRDRDGATPLQWCLYHASITAEQPLRAQYLAAASYLLRQVSHINQLTELNGHGNSVATLVGQLGNPEIAAQYEQIHAQFLGVV